MLAAAKFLLAFSAEAVCKVRLSAQSVVGLGHFHFLNFLFFPVLMEAKLSFVEPGCRWASKALGISYQGTMKISVRMLKTSGGL